MRLDRDDEDREPRDATLVRVVAIITLGAILFASVVGLTVVAVFTERDLFRAETFTFGGLLLLVLLGGLSWVSIRGRHRRWRLRVDRNGGDESESDDE